MSDLQKILTKMKMKKIIQGYGWKNIQVKHRNGRTGKIIYEDANFGGIALQIKADNDTEAWIDLSATFGDTGEPGWSWLCTNFNGNESRWLELGN